MRLVLLCHDAKECIATGRACHLQQDMIASNDLTSIVQTLAGEATDLLGPAPDLHAELLGVGSSLGGQHCG